VSRPDGADDRAAWVRRAAETLAAAGCEDPRAEAEDLWCRASGEGRAALALRRGEPAPAAAVARLRDWLPRFAAGEPLAYLEGCAGFHGIELLADARALVPRADSEAVVELALAHADASVDARVADLGTGSGCLLLALLHARPRWHGVGVDRSAAALALAASNAHRLALDARCRFVRADWLDGVRGRFALIVSNPPYVEPGEELGHGVAEFEPHAALFTPPGDPLHAYRRILTSAPAALAPDGVLVCEVGAGRADAVAALARSAGWRECGRRRDLGGVERALAFRLD
jgi:release factor glutamine methyltransferase